MLYAAMHVLKTECEMRLIHVYVHSCILSAFMKGM